MPRITRRTFVAAPAEFVWGFVEDFAEWHPKLRQYPNGPEAPADLVVTVLSRDEQTLTLCYSMPEPPFPITGHKATIQVEPMQSLSSHVTWSADFDADPEILLDLEDQLGDDIFDLALDRLAAAAQESHGAAQVAANVYSVH